MLHKARTSQVLIAAAVALSGAFALQATSVSAAASKPSAPAVRGVTTATHFIVTATSSNTSGDSVYINNAATNGHPRAFLFITHNHDPGALCGSCFNENVPTGVWYDSNNNQWAIFNEDASAMQVGEDFNVLVVSGGGSSVFLQRAFSSNTSGDSTYINNAATNGKPTVRLTVTQNYDAFGVCPCVFNNRNIGVWYDNSVGKWAIFNQDQSTPPLHAQFNVLVNSGQSGHGTSVLQTSTGSNTVNESTKINNPLTNGHNNALIFATPNYDPGGVCACAFENHPIGVWTNGTRWLVYNEDLANMAIPESFNLLIYSS
jgi:hypothetical protein